MARLALVLHEGKPGFREDRLWRILQFFGVQCELLSLSELEGTFTRFGERGVKYAVLGSVEAVAATQMREKESALGPVLESAATLYLYLSDDIPGSKQAFQVLSSDSTWSLQRISGPVVLKVSKNFREVTGPMTGLEISSHISPADWSLVPTEAGRVSALQTIVSANGASVFVRFQLNGVPSFFSSSAEIIDIDRPIEQGFYDVKEHFCSTVPLVMFIRWAFADAVWRPQELGACIIVDDPLLKSRYGLCDFRKLANLSKRHGFTTNIAFIPWNWRRTSRKDSELFRSEMGHFSISIHGCDHTAEEFGGSDIGDLAGKAQLAQSRMRIHEARSGIRHEPIMVFPQGVFSAESLSVLKKTNFVAAVNTEVAPVGTLDPQTLIRDVWDVAITKYGSFALFTRRYPHHGLENFAFDLLLGKPCLVVTHHEFFRNEGEALIELIEKLSSLNCNLRWRPLGEVIRRACRYRVTETGAYEYWMYAQELSVKIGGVEPALVTIRGKEDEPAVISKVASQQGELKWKAREGYIEFSANVPPGEERLFRVVCQEYPELRDQSRNLKFKLHVAARRLLSELRDECMFQGDRLRIPGTHH